MQDWYLFKEKNNSHTMEYLGFLSYTIPIKEKNKRFKQIVDKNREDNCYFWAMKVVKGVQN